MSVQPRSSWLNWRTGIIIVLAVFVALFLVNQILNSITYPVVPATALFPEESQVLVSATLSRTDEGLLQVIGAFRNLQNARKGRRGGGGFFSRFSGQKKFEDSFPSVLVWAAWGRDPADQDMDVLQAQSISRSVVIPRMMFGCRPAPKNGQKLKYGGETLFLQTAQDKTLLTTMAKNCFLLSTDTDVVKGIIDKVHSGNTDLAVTGELGALYGQYYEKYPFAAAAANDQGQVRLFVHQFFVEDASEQLDRAEEQLGVKFDTLRLLAVGAKFASADKLEASGVAVCTDAAAAQALASAMNEKLQRPVKEGQWSAKTTATADGDRVNVDVEVGGLMELAAQLLEKAEKEQKAQATAAATPPGSAPPVDTPAPPATPAENTERQPAKEPASPIQ